jgi:hypothetical protein
MSGNLDFQAARGHFARYGIELPADVRHFITDEHRSMALDAQPALTSVSSTGIPSFLTTYIDPGFIDVLFAPMKGAEILGEVKKGSWVTSTLMFPYVESTGETSAYGDWNNNGSAGVNLTFPQRQSFHYQTVTQWGEKQLEQAAEAKLSYAAQLNIASALVLNKYQDRTYHLGVAGLQCYGLLNDPSLSTALTPGTKAAGGTSWSVATPNEIYIDIQALYAKLVTQTTGLVDMNAKMTMVLPQVSSVYLTNANSFNVQVQDLVKKNFPNIRIVTDPLYAVSGGNLVQLIVDSYEGQDTGYCAFTEKLRAHPIIREMSAFKQKKSQGTFGAVIFRPAMIAQMLGI